MYKLGSEKTKESEIKLPTTVGSLKKQQNSRKTSPSASLTIPKPLTLWITTNGGKFFKRWWYQTTLPASWETCMQIKNQWLKPEVEQWTGSKLEKEYVKAVYCHLASSTSMQSTSCEMPGWMNPKLDRDCWEKYQQPQICRWYHSNSIKWRGNKEPPDEGKKGEWKRWLKTQYQKKKKKSCQLVPSLCKYKGKKWKQWQILFS